MLVFFFNDAATTEIYTLSLHDALPILEGGTVRGAVLRIDGVEREVRARLTLAADGLRSRFARRLGLAAGDGGRRKLGLAAPHAAPSGGAPAAGVHATGGAGWRLVVRGGGTNPGLGGGGTGARGIGGEPP